VAPKQRLVHPASQLVHACAGRQLGIQDTVPVQSQSPELDLEALRYALALVGVGVGVLAECN
jgi:hypothetical protein